VTITNGYVTLDDLTDWLDGQVGPAQQADAERAVETASRWVDEYCGQHFFASSETRVFDACSSVRVELGGFNQLVSVTTLKTDDNLDGTFETTWSSSTDYQLLPRLVTAQPDTRSYTGVHAIGSKSFPLRTSTTSRYGLVEIVGSWGWAATPTPVKQATLIQSAVLLARRQSVQGVAGFGEFGVVRLSRNVDATVAELLGPYRIAAGVGIA
jgi:hypothetical protein